MGKLLNKASSENALYLAWYRIRSNGYQSSLPETRDAVKDFEREAKRNIHKIQRALRKQSFEFLPQTGVAKKKRSGGYRGIVMAPIQNRIVERALLDCLQENVDYIKEVINTPTSIGGVPDRSVPHGLAIICDAFKNGKKYFVRSDITGFFDHIPRETVLKKLLAYIDDKSFLEVLDNATTVILKNEQSLGENRKAFPTDSEGVAQGSPLSPLIGNIFLHDFDKEFNDRGIICIRFIDDFVLLGDSEGQVRKAFKNAKKVLKSLNLDCHDPYEKKTSIEKAQYGEVSEGFIFLGYDIRPGLIQPSASSRKKLLENIDKHIIRGRSVIFEETSECRNGCHNTQRYTQTLALIDNVVRGWGNAFAYSNAPDTIQALDKKIDEKIAGFRQWFKRFSEKMDSKNRRRAGGVCLLEDIPQKNLDELPFSLGKRKGHQKTKNTITVSTDGSLLQKDRFTKKEKGTGGWAVVFHEGREFSGGVELTTNNRMELTAVIEALKRTPERSRVLIRTDSQYVHNAAEKGETIGKNHDLWREFIVLRESRKVTIVWVKAHNGDPHNERADKLAGEAAKSLQINQDNQMYATGTI